MLCVDVSARNTRRSILSIQKLPFLAEKLKSLVISTTYVVCFFLICFLPGRVAQSVTCLATDACLTAIPGVASSIPA